MGFYKYNMVMDALRVKEVGSPGGSVDWKLVKDADIDGGQALRTVVGDERVVDSLGYDYYHYQVGEEGAADFLRWYGDNNWIPHSSMSSKIRRPLLPLAIFRCPSVKAFFSELDPTKRSILVERLYKKSIGIHLRRLWSTDHGEELQRFCVNFMGALLRADESLIEGSIPASVDGSAAATFWTIGPYLFIKLMNLGMDEDAAFLHTIGWAGARTGASFEEPDRSFPGLGQLETSLGSRMFLLSGDSQGQSHSIACDIGRQLAISIVDQVGVCTNLEPEKLESSSGHEQATREIFLGLVYLVDHPEIVGKFLPTELTDNSPTIISLRWGTDEDIGGIRDSLLRGTYLFWTDEMAKNYNYLSFGLEITFPKIDIEGLWSFGDFDIRIECADFRALQITYNMGLFTARDKALWNQIVGKIRYPVFVADRFGNRYANDAAKRLGDTTDYR